MNSRFNPMTFKPRTILDVLQDTADFRKQREETERLQLENMLTGAKVPYANQMSQEELRKIQLANLIQQAKAKYAEQNEQASLQDVLAGTAGKNMRNQYLNQKMQAGMNPNQQESIFPNQQGMQGRIQPLNLKSGWDTPSGLNAQLQYVLNNNANPSTGQPFSSPEESGELEDQIRKRIDRKSLPEATQTFLDQAKTIKRIFLKTDFNRIKKYFGAVGRLRRGADIVKRVFGGNTEDYNKFSQFMTQDAPTIADLIRAALKGSVQKDSRLKYLDLVSKDYWLTNPEAAAFAFKNVQELYDDEFKSKLDVSPPGGYYRKVFSVYYPEFAVKRNNPPNQEKNMNENKNVQINQMSNQPEQKKAMIIQKAKAELARRKREGLYNG